MISGDTRYRVYNRCKHDIGVVLANSLQVNIRPGSFAIMSLNDVMFIESISESRFFGKKMLVAIDNDGRELQLEEAGLPTEEENVHLEDEDIASALKQPIKKLEAWLSEVTDPVELHNIYNVAKGMDLPSSKLKLLSEKMPGKDWLDNE